MSASVCHWPWWQPDTRFSFCFEQVPLSFFIPSISLTVSFFLICLDVSGFWSRRHHFQGTSGHLAPVNEDELSISAHAAQCAATISNPVQILEALILVADIFIETCLIFQNSSLAIFGSLLLSIYLVGLLAARRAYPQVRRRLRIHSEVLYGLQCTLIFVFITIQADFIYWSLLIRLALFIMLTMFHWMAPNLPLGTVDPSSLGRDESASLVSRLSFSWLENLLWRAFGAGPLERSDLYALNRRLTSLVVTSAFRRASFATQSLLWRMFQFLKIEFLRQGIWAGINSVFVFVPAMLIKSILEYLETPSPEASQNAWFRVFGLLAASLMAGFSACQCGWIGKHIGFKVRAILLDRIYAKILRRRLAGSLQTSDRETNIEEQRTSDGAIYNFVSNDVHFISSMSGALYLVWVTFPMQITIGTCLLYSILGISGIIGLVCMVALLPLHVRLSRHLAAVQGKLLAASDGRIQASNELLNAIRTTKYYAWEDPFRARVLAKRRTEMRIMRSRFIWWSISMTVFHSLPFIVSMVTLFFYTVVFKGQLVTSVAFPALAIFGVVRIPLDRCKSYVLYFPAIFVAHRHDLRSRL